MEREYAVSQNPRQRRRRKKSAALAPRERRRLVQLCVCAALFFAVFWGRGIFPERMEAVRQDLLEVISRNTDFSAAFSDLGRAVENQAPLGDALAELWVTVFAGAPATQPSSDPAAEMANPPVEASPIPTITTPAETAAVETSQPPQPEPQATAIAEPEPVYTGPALPDNATMERLSLGLEETTSPVMAVVSSGYGWREDPLGDGEKFHSGVDLAAAYGEPIGAFAVGVVDYIGESPAYGQYIQIKHDGGVTSFYAHCSELCAQPGQQVAMGEKIAEVGATGDVTGPHLHLELKLNGVRLDPLYYIDYLEG